MVNGGFDQNQCTAQTCAWNNQNFQTAFLPGWYPTP